jgi:hypothetical protein
VVHPTVVRPTVVHPTVVLPTVVRPAARASTTRRDTFGSVRHMASPRRIAEAALVVLCYVLWTAVLLGVGAAGALWLIGRIGGDRTESSSTYQVLHDNALVLLGGSAVMAVLAAALSVWLDRTLE